MDTNVNKDKHVFVFCLLILFLLIASMPIIEYFYAINQPIKTYEVNRADLERIKIGFLSQYKMTINTSVWIEDSSFEVFITGKEYRELKDGDSVRTSDFTMNHDQKSLKLIEQEALFGALLDVIVIIIYIGIQIELNKKRLEEQKKEQNKK